MAGQVRAARWSASLLRIFSSKIQPYGFYILPLREGPCYHSSMATMTILFEDGTERVIDLGQKCVEIDLPDAAKQSISVHQTPRGEYRMSFTKPLMVGKKFQSITISKG